MIDLLKSLKIHQYNAELIDIRIEETLPCTISFFQKEFNSFSEEKNIGAFIRVYANNKWYHASTTEIDKLEQELHKLLNAAKLSTTQQSNKNIELKETIINTIKDDYALSLSKEEKIEYINKIRGIIESDELVITPSVVWSDKVVRKYFVNNKGVVYSYDKAFSGILYSFTLKENDNLFNTYKQKSFQLKSELVNLYDEFKVDFDEAKLFINAPTIESGKYTVVLSPQATGIFAHESFGHKSEADFMLGDEKMKEEWEIGKKVANEVVSIVDCGMEPTVSGYCPFDDEGNPAQKTYLIKNGILAGRLHSEETAKILNEAVTGNAQAINFEFEPIVRMTNTYFEKGDLSFDDLIKPIENGYYIKSVTHGSGMSTFTMAVNRAYKIENGKVTHPVKINMTTGTVFQTLHSIDGIGNEVVISNQVFGGCGKGYQWPLNVAFGGPCIRIKSYNLS